MTFIFYLLALFNYLFVVNVNCAVQTFLESSNTFTTNLFREITATSPENVVFSPISLQIVLALTLEGAKETTALELATALNLPSKSATQTAIQSLNFNISSESLTLRSSNALYIADDYDILPSFLGTAYNTYQTELANIDFSNGNTAAALINQWVSNRTNGTIENLLEPTQLDALTKFILINSLYFKGQWTKPFDSDNSHPDKFYTGSNTSIDVQMMNSANNYLFLDSQELKATFLELGYKKSNMSMTFVLPHERNGLEKISDIGKYLKRQELTSERVSISIPSFNYSSLVDFKKILQTLGVKELFEDTGNLTGISTKPGLFVKHVIQKTFLGISESGTLAASATGVIGALRTIPPPPPELVFKADHPFLFYVRDNISGVILFVGRYVK